MESKITFKRGCILLIEKCWSTACVIILFGEKHEKFGLFMLLSLICKKLSGLLGLECLSELLIYIELLHGWLFLE